MGSSVHCRLLLHLGALYLFFRANATPVRALFHFSCLSHAQAVLFISSTAARASAPERVFMIPLTFFAAFCC